jgi:elongation factor Ts
MMECKKALEEAGGDEVKALNILSMRAKATVGKKAGRALVAGTVASYVHNTAQVGALVLLSCETDFVSKNDEFMALARDIAMHICAMRPADVSELSDQAFIKDPSKTIADLVSAAVQKFGERIEVSEFSCLAVK